MLAACGVNAYIVTMTIWQPILGEHSRPRYLAIVETLARDVDSGALAPGSRLPTHRDLADRLGVTVGTVSRAYAEAARRGLVSGEVGRGTFVRGEAIEDASDEGDGVVDLAQKPSPRDGEPAAKGGAGCLADLVRRACRLRGAPRLSGGWWQRCRPRGRRTVDRARGCGGGSRPGAGVHREPARHHGGPGHRDAAGETCFLTESLTYAGLKSVAGFLHLKLAGLAVDEHGLRPEAFEDACRKGKARALYVIPMLHNPTTAVMPLERRRADRGDRHPPRRDPGRRRRARPSPRGAAGSPGRSRSRPDPLSHQHVQDPRPRLAYRLRPGTRGTWCRA